METTKNKNLIITIVSLLVLIIIGVFLYQNYTQANADATCTQTLIYRGSETGNCGDLTWGDWETDPVDSEYEIRTAVGHVYTRWFTMKGEGTNRTGLTPHEIVEQGLTDQLIAEGYSCDMNGRVYAGINYDQYNFTSPGKVVRNKDLLRGEIEITESRTEAACQAEERREKDSCNKTFSPFPEDLCEGVVETASNSCGEEKEVVGIKNCEVECIAGVDEPWMLPTETHCLGEFFFQYSCGERQWVEGTQTCGVVKTCDDGFGNQVPGIDSNGDGYCDVYEPREINLEMECSLDGINWEDCEAHVWQLIHRRIPITIKLVPTGDECSIATADPLFISNLLTLDITSNFGEISKVQDAFLVDMKVEGDITTKVFTKKVKATYCGENGEIEKDIQIKVLNLDYVEQ